MRKKWTVTSDYGIYTKIKELSEMTRIPISKLLDEGIEDLLIKHDFDKIKKNFEIKKNINK